MREAKTGLRTIKRVSDGITKIVPSGNAARLVSKGTYAYIDGDFDASIINVQKALKQTITYNRMSPLLNNSARLLNVNPIKKPPIGPKKSFHLAPKKETKTIESENPQLQIGSIVEKGSVLKIKERGDRKVIKADSISEEAVAAIRAAHSISSAPITTVASESTLKTLIEQKKKSRAKAKIAEQEAVAE